MGSVCCAAAPQMGVEAAAGGVVFIFSASPILHSAEGCFGLQGVLDQPSELSEIMHSGVHA